MRSFNYLYVIYKVHDIYLLFHNNMKDILITRWRRTLHRTTTMHSTWQRITGHPEHSRGQPFKRITAVDWNPDDRVAKKWSGDRKRKKNIWSTIPSCDLSRFHHCQPFSLFKKMIPSFSVNVNISRALYRFTRKCIFVKLQI